jgi:hypothetical protein
MKKKSRFDEEMEEMDEVRKAKVAGKRRAMRRRAERNAKGKL